MNEDLESFFAGFAVFCVFAAIGLYAVQRECLKRQSWRASIEQVELLKKFQGEHRQ